MEAAPKWAAFYLFQNGRTTSWWKLEFGHVPSERNFPENRVLVFSDPANGNFMLGE
jgi:hypothetical protein